MVLWVEGCLCDNDFMGLWKLERNTLHGLWADYFNKNWMFSSSEVKIMHSIQS
jgi:hypothetical protein